MLEVTAARDETVKKKPEPLPKKIETPSPYGSPDSASKRLAERSSVLKNQEETQKLILPLRQEIQELKELVMGMQSRPSQENYIHSQLQQEVSEVRHMVQALAAQSSQLRDEELSENLVVLFQQMVFNGLEEKFARRLIQEAKKSRSERRPQHDRRRAPVEIAGFARFARGDGIAQ